MIKHILLLLFLPIVIFASTQKVSVQLDWKHQFEFAGFYAAKSQGYYRDINLEVELRELELHTNICDEVLENRADFGLSSSSLILDKLQNRPVVLIASYFKQNALALVTTKDIKSIQDLKNRKIMATQNEIEKTSLSVMLKENSLNREDFTLIKQDFSVNKFISGEIDAMTIFTTNQLYYLDKNSIEYNIFSPADYGIYSYDSELFTSLKYTKLQPKLVKEFTEATRKGWEYAFGHKEEIIKLIHDEYSSKKSIEALRYEATQIEKLFKTETFQIGSIVPELVELNAVIYEKLGLVDKNINLKKLLTNYIFYDKYPKTDKNQKIYLTKEENRFLKNHPLIKVHMEENYSLFSYIKNDKFIGYSIDYADMVAKRLGITFSYNRDENWKQAIDNLKSFKTDIIAQMINTKERHKFALFSDNYMKYDQAIVVQKKDKHLSCLAKLHGKKVGVVNGYNTADVIAKRHPEIILVKYTDDKELVKGVHLGEVDAGVSTHQDMQYKINTLLLNNLVSIPILNNPYMPETLEAFGIRKDWPLMHSALQKAFKSISAEEITNLQLKWFGRVDSKINFTDEELNFIAQNRVIKIANEMSWAPFDYNEFGKPSGMSIEYIKLLFKKANLRYEMINGYTWDELLKLFKAKKIDLIPAIYKSDEREKFALFTTPYYQGEISVYTLNSNRSINSLEDLTGKRVGVEKSDASSLIVKKYFNESKIIEYSNTSELLERLNTDHLDAIVSNPLVLKHYSQKRKDSNLKYLGNLFMSSKEHQNISLHIAVKKEMQTLYSILQKTINSLNDSEISDLNQKWLEKLQDEKDILNVKEREYLNKNSITMCIDPNWMPFEKLEDETHIGMSADYFKIINQNLRTNIKIVPTSSWSESVKKAKKRECDLLSLAMHTPQREEYMNFTSPYLSVPLVLATKMDVPFIADLKSIKEEKVGIAQGYAFAEILKDKYPDLKIVQVKNIQDGLRRVSRGELFGYIGTLASVGYMFQKEYIGELKIAGKFDESWKLGIGVRNDNPTLLSIMQKAVNSIDKEQKREILNRWIVIKYEKGVDYSLVWKLLLVFSLIIIAALFWFTKLSLLNKKLKIAKQKAEEATQTKANFLANMSHEIRTPMNSIIGMSYLIKETKLNRTQLDYIEKIENSSHNLLTLINNILDFSKMEIKKLELKNDNFNLLQVLNDIENILKIKTFEKELSLQIVYNKSDNFHLYGDSLRLSQVLINLVSNAIKFTQKGEVKVIVEKQEGNLFRFIITDTGIGLTQEQAESVFSSFTQADSSITRKYGGTGLGLSISKELVELMGGKIWVESIYGEGSRFIFEIPIQNSSSTFLDAKIKNKLKSEDLQEKKPLIEKVKLQELLEELKEATKRRRPQLCEPILKKINIYTLEKEDQKLFDTVEKLILKYKFEDARILLDER